MERWVGVGYTPLAVNTQVVSGVNYCFLCTGVVVTPEQSEIVALVCVYAPLDGDPHISEIKRIGH